MLILSICGIQFSLLFILTKGYKEQQAWASETNDKGKVLIIEEKMKQLTDQEKEIFHLYYIEGYKIKEIAKMKNQKTNYMKVKLHRIRKKLRRE